MEHLPSDVLQNIASQLQISHLLLLQSTCTSLYSSIQQNHQLWLSVLLHDFPKLANTLASISSPSFRTLCISKHKMDKKWWAGRLLLASYKQTSQFLQLPLGLFLVCPILALLGVCSSRSVDWLLLHFALSSCALWMQCYKLEMHVRGWRGFKEDLEEQLINSSYSTLFGLYHAGHCAYLCIISSIVTFSFFKPSLTFLAVSPQFFFYFFPLLTPLSVSYTLIGISGTHILVCLVEHFFGAYFNFGVQSVHPWVIITLSLFTFWYYKCEGSIFENTAKTKQPKTIQKVLLLPTSLPYLSVSWLLPHPSVSWLLSHLLLPSSLPYLSVSWLLSHSLLSSEEDLFDHHLLPASVVCIISLLVISVVSTCLFIAFSLLRSCDSRWVPLYVSSITMVLVFLHLLPYVAFKHWFNLLFACSCIALILNSVADNSLHSFVPRLLPSFRSVQTTAPLPLLLFYTIGVMVPSFIIYFCCILF